MTPNFIPVNLLTLIGEIFYYTQTLDDTLRRKELYQALSTNMADIFKWQLCLLDQYYVAYKSQQMSDTGKLHALVMQAR